MLFDEVTIEHIRQAVDDFNKKGIPNGFSTSKYYDVKIDNILYPPKPIMAIANNFATGRKIENYFSGGIDTPCFKAFERLGIEIIIKSNTLKNLQEMTQQESEKHLNFHKLIEDFLEQAETNNLKTKHYPKSYNDLKIKVSFGAGNQARIPWIALLKEPNKVTEGIYPVYLYFRNIEKLILAYGLSETNNPKVKWNLSNPITIDRYFSKNDLGKPDRYGDSYIYKVYDIKNLPDKDTINNDLENLIAVYQNHSDPVVSSQDDEIRSKNTNFNLSYFIKSTEKAGLNYSPPFITRYIASLATKPFVLLSGLSGSGKTKLAQAFSQWISEDTSQHCIVPVGADWTNREPLLGYVNALDNSEYIKPENGALQILLDANKNRHKPYFLILDEMNLSHVERYFADFLSVMESKDIIKLHSSDEDKSQVPSKVNWPSNLFIVGTVNIDETTYMFSPKVLDRANVIEFRVNKVDIENFLKSPKEIDFRELNGQGASMGEDFLRITTNKDFPSITTTKLNEKLVQFFEELKKTGAEFGYRSATEIHKLYNQLSTIDREMSENAKIDIAIMQKLLPKLHGSRRKLCPILEVLASFCVSDTTDATKSFLNNKESLNYTENSSVLYPLSLEKITRMYKGAIDNGFASYAEA